MVVPPEGVEPVPPPAAALGGRRRRRRGRGPLGALPPGQARLPGVVHGAGETEHPGRPAGGGRGIQEGGGGVGRGERWIDPDGEGRGGDGEGKPRAGPRGVGTQAGHGNGGREVGIGEVEGAGGRPSSSIRCGARVRAWARDRERQPRKVGRTDGRCWCWVWGCGWAPSGGVAELELQVATSTAARARREVQLPSPPSMKFQFPLCLPRILGPGIVLLHGYCSWIFLCLSQFNCSSYNKAINIISIRLKRVNKRTKTCLYTSDFERS